MIILLVVASLLTPLLTSAQDYGKPLPQCGSSGQIYGGNNLKAAIEALPTGGTLRLKAGTYSLSGKVRMAAKTLLAPAPTPLGGCQKAIIKLTQPNTMIIPGHESIIEGLHLSHRTDCTANNNDETCNQRRIIWISAEQPTTGVRIRHNVIGPGGDLIYVGHGSKQTLIKHNQLLGAKRWCVGVRGNPNTATTIRRNHFRSCEGDYIQTEYQSDLIIDRNQFDGGGQKQILDIKAPKGPTAVTNNLFDCANQAASCILFHSETPTRTDDDRHTFSGNLIQGCGNNNRAAVFGGDKPGSWYHLGVANNTWQLPDQSCRIELWKCKFCEFDQNLTQSGILISHPEAKNLRITNNQFVETRFDLKGDPYLEGNDIGKPEPSPPPQIMVFTTSSGDRVRITIEQLK